MVIGWSWGGYRVVIDLASIKLHLTLCDIDYNVLDNECSGHSMVIGL